MRLYTIYDNVAEEASPLFEAKNDALAFRMFDAIDFPKDVKRQDLQLYCVGSFKHDPIVLLALDKPRFVQRICDEDESEEAAMDVMEA